MISIIVPFYNSAEFLEECVTSILNQSYKNFEVLLVDDGSKDNSLDICKGFANKDSRICVLHQENNGVTAARRLGMEYSRGEFLCFVDSDDTMDKNALEVMVAKMTDDVDIVTTWETAEQKISGTEYVNRLLQKTTNLALWGKLYRKDLVIRSHALDIGSTTVIIWLFEEREKLLEFYERATGARMHANYFRPGGVRQDIPLGLLNDLYIFCNEFNDRLDDMEELLTNNRIWRERLVDIGVITKQAALDLNLTGVLLRSTGVKWDLRKTFPYDAYDKVQFDIPVGTNGDCFDRFIIRIEEMRQSVRIINQCINQISEGPIKSDNYKISIPSKVQIKQSMEALIDHFKIFSEGFKVEPNEVYCSIEAPKGEFGVYLVSDGSNKPYRCHLKSSGFIHLQSLDYLTRGHLIADVTTVIGSLDIVFGDIDR